MTFECLPQIVVSPPYLPSKFMTLDTQLSKRLCSSEPVAFELQTGLGKEA